MNAVPKPAQPRRHLSRQAIISDVMAGLPNKDIMTRHDLTDTGLKVVLGALKAEGRLTEIYECPQCGFRMSEPIEDCPRCGVIKAKLASLQTRHDTVWTLLMRHLESVWDAIDCGGYRLIKRLQGKWKNSVQ